jgi:hypothetical protein
VGLNRPRQKQDGGVSPSTRVGALLRCRSSASLLPVGPADQPEGWLASPVDGLVSCAEAHLTSLPGLDSSAIPKNGFVVRGVRFRAPKHVSASPNGFNLPVPKDQSALPGGGVRRPAPKDRSALP